MTLDLDKLVALARAATPGPWELERSEVVVPYSENNPALSSPPRVRMPHGRVAEMRGISARNEDADFIAACSPDVILALVAEVRELRSGLGEAIHELELHRDPAEIPELLAALRALLRAGRPR